MRRRADFRAGDHGVLSERRACRCGAADGESGPKAFFLELDKKVNFFSA